VDRQHLDRQYLDRQRLAAAALAAALLFAALTDYVPQFRDESGKVFGLFALDIYKDALHVASGVWAAVAAMTSRRASEAFLRIFGTLYLADGIMGVFTGSGFLDLSIITEGVRNVSTTIKFLSSLPHLLLGLIGVWFGWMEGQPGSPRDIKAT
jgi:Domain of unknown function (DUF4383)